MKARSVRCASFRKGHEQLGRTVGTYSADRAFFVQVQDIEVAVAIDPRAFDSGCELVFFGEVGRMKRGILCHSHRNCQQQYSENCSHGIAA